MTEQRVRRPTIRDVAREAGVSSRFLNGGKWVSARAHSERSKQRFGGSVALQPLSERRPDLDAVFAANDLMAAGEWGGSSPIGP